MRRHFSLRLFALTFVALLICTGCGKTGKAALPPSADSKPAAAAKAGTAPSCADEILHPISAGEGAKYFDTALLLSEDNYSDEMQNVVSPYLDGRMHQGTLDTERGSKIHYETFTADGGTDANGGALISAGKYDTIVIFEGFSEFTRKHDETTYYFLKSGYNVCIFDHRGLGLSSRDKEIAADVNATSLVYIDSFDTYIADSAEAVEKAALPMTKGTGRLLLFAHSMGGCIGALFLEQYPDVFDMAVLTSPMLATNTGVPEWMASSLSNVMDGIGKGAAMAVGQKTYSASINSPKNLPSYADSVPRVKYKAFLRESDTHYQTTAATYSWTAHAVKATHQAVKRRNIRKITAPILMFQSEHDTRVRPAGQNRFRRRSSGSHGAAVTLVYYPCVRHEIYNSRNEYLAPYYDRILRFYAGE